MSLCSPWLRTFRTAVLLKPTKKVDVRKATSTKAISMLIRQSFDPNTSGGQVEVLRLRFSSVEPPRLALMSNIWTPGGDQPANNQPQPAEGGVPNPLGIPDDQMPTEEEM